MTTNDARCIREIKSRIAMVRRRLISPADWTQNLRKKLVKCCVEHSFVWCWNLDSRRVDYKCIETVEMWRWKRRGN